MKDYLGFLQEYRGETGHAPIQDPRAHVSKYQLREHLRMKSIYTLLKQPFFGKYRVKWAWPAGTEQAAWQAVPIKSGSGATLAGLFGEAEGIPLGTIVLAHPMGRAAKGHWLKNGLAMSLRARGFHVLAFDFNGFGESGEGNFRYPLDVIAAGNWLQERFPDSSIGVHGASFGAAWALCACAMDDHPFDWAVLENPFTTLGEFWVRYKLANAVLKMIAAVRPSLERALNPEYQAPRLQALKSLQLHFGSNDTTTPAAMGERLSLAAKTSGIGLVELQVWNEVAHNQCFPRWKEQYLETWNTC